MKKLISQYLTLGGGATASINANGNYSTASVIFSINPPAGSIYKITRIIYTIKDGAGIQTETYGALAALTNGVEVYVSHNGAIEYYLTDENNPVKTNSQWSALCYDQEYRTLGGGDALVQGRWTLSKIAPGGVTLNGDDSDFLAVGLSDTLTGLVAHNFLVQGEVLAGPAPQA
jgi:hypothetical protein